MFILFSSFLCFPGLPILPLEDGEEAERAAVRELQRLVPGGVEVMLFLCILFSSMFFYFVFLNISFRRTAFFCWYA